jgi:hypothetical protein
MNKRGQGGSELRFQEKWHIASRNGGTANYPRETLWCQRLPDYRPSTKKGGGVFCCKRASRLLQRRGTFRKLPDGGIVTINGNNLQANYEGGDGNDLTLTVVP